MDARRIQSGLLRQRELSLSLATIYKVLKKHQVKPARKYPRKKDFILYQRPIPGGCVQMDTCKIGSGLIQYSAVDDFTRYRILRLFGRCTATHTLEFITEKVQKRLMEYNIKFRLNKLGSPPLYGKV